MVQMTVARDGVEAIEYLRQCKIATSGYPDLMILDLNLPRKNGHEVLAEVKSDLDLRKIPVLVMTSSHDEDDIAQAYNLNANCYIRKPDDLPEYERVVRAIEDFWFSTVTLPETYALTATSGLFATNAHRLQ